MMECKAGGKKLSTNKSFTVWNLNLFYDDVNLMHVYDVYGEGRSLQFVCVWGGGGLYCSGSYGIQMLSTFEPTCMVLRKWQRHYCKVYFDV